MASPKKISAIVEQAIKHSENVVSYSFSLERQLPLFKPGQFLHLALDDYDPSQGWPESRVFSIASSPLSRNNLKIIVSVQGSFTKRMYDEIENDQQIWLKMPYGDFVFDDSDHPLVLIAGGTGISPYISFLNTLCYSGNRMRKIHLYYGIRSSKLIIFNDLFDTYRESLANFKLTLYCQEKSTPLCRMGILNIDDIIEETCKSESIYYISGPLAMVQSFQTKLSGSGIAEENIKIDQWN